MVWYFLLYVLKCVKGFYFMHTAGNSLGPDGGIALGQWLSALTSLQTLNLRGKTPCLLLLLVKSVFHA
jgi:hypothetical protein